MNEAFESVRDLVKELLTFNSTIPDDISNNSKLSILKSLTSLAMTTVDLQEFIGLEIASHSNGFPEICRQFSHRRMEVRVATVYFFSALLSQNHKNQRLLLESATSSSQKKNIWLLDQAYLVFHTPKLLKKEYRRKQNRYFELQGYRIPHGNPPTQNQFHPVKCFCNYCHGTKEVAPSLWYKHFNDITKWRDFDYDASAITAPWITFADYVKKKYFIPANSIMENYTSTVTSTTHQQLTVNFLSLYNDNEKITDFSREQVIDPSLSIVGVLLHKQTLNVLKNEKIYNTSPIELKNQCLQNNVAENRVILFSGSLEMLVLTNHNLIPIPNCKKVLENEVQIDGNTVLVSEIKSYLVEVQGIFNNLKSDGKIVQEDFISALYMISGHKHIFSNFLNKSPSSEVHEGIEEFLDHFKDRDDSKCIQIEWSTFIKYFGDIAKYFANDEKLINSDDTGLSNCDCGEEMCTTNKGSKVDDGDDYHEEYEDDYDDYDNDEYEYDDAFEDDNSAKQSHELKNETIRDVSNDNIVELVLNEMKDVVCKLDFSQRIRCYVEFAVDLLKGDILIQAKPNDFIKGQSEFYAIQIPKETLSFFQNEGTFESASNLKLLQLSEESIINLMEGCYILDENVEEKECMLSPEITLFLKPVNNLNGDKSIAVPIDGLCPKSYATLFRLKEKLNENLLDNGDDNVELLAILDKVIKLCNNRISNLTSTTVQKKIHKLVANRDDAILCVSNGRQRCQICRNILIETAKKLKLIGGQNCEKIRIMLNDRLKTVLKYSKSCQANELKFDDIGDRYLLPTTAPLMKNTKTKSKLMRRLIVGNQQSLREKEEQKCQNIRDKIKRQEAYFARMGK